MANKVTIAKASRVYGASVQTADLTDVNTQIFLGSKKETAEDVAKLVNECVNKGLATLVMHGVGNTTVVSSKKSDGFCREVTDENYDWKMAVCPFVSQAKWEELVDGYYSRLLHDEEALAVIRAIIQPALNIVPLPGNAPFNAGDVISDIADYVRTLKGTEKSQGERKPNLFTQLTKEHTVYHFSGLLNRHVDAYVKLNTKKQWKK